MSVDNNTIDNDKERKENISSSISKLKEQGIDEKVIKAINLCMIKNYNAHKLKILCDAAENGCVPEEIAYASTIYDNKSSELAAECLKYFDLGYDIAAVKDIMNKCEESAYKMSYVRKHMTNDESDSRDEVIEKFIEKANNIINELKTDRDYYMNLVDKATELLRSRSDECTELKEMLKEQICQDNVQSAHEIEKILNEKQSQVATLQKESERYRELYTDSIERLENLQSDYGKLISSKKRDDEMTDKQVQMLLKAFEDKHLATVAIINELCDVKEKLSEMEKLLTKSNCENYMLKKKKISELFGVREKNNNKEAARGDEKKDGKQELLKLMFEKKYTAMQMNIIGTGLSNGITAEVLTEIVNSNSGSIEADELKSIINILSGQQIFSVDESVSESDTHMEEEYYDDMTSVSDETISEVTDEFEYPDDEEEEYL